MNYTFFTMAEIEQAKADGLVEKMHDDFKSGKIDFMDYGMFIVNMLGNYVKKLISEFHATALSEFEDCVNSAILAILEHAKDFDPRKGSLTTYFDKYIRAALVGGMQDPDGSKYYDYVIRDLDKTSQSYGFSGVSDPQLTVQRLYILCDQKFQVATIQRAIDYKKTTQVCSLDSISDNFEGDNPFGNPLDQVINKERDSTIKKLMKSKCTSFERYLINECVETGDMTSFRGIVSRLKAMDYKTVFADDAIAEKNTVDINYLTKRYNGVMERLRNNATIKTYGTKREKAVFCVSDEQALETDIADAFNAGDLF